MFKADSIIPLKMLLFNFHAANTIVVSFLPLFLQYKGLEGKEIGWVLAIGPAAAIVSQPFWGYMSDRYQTVKRVLIVSLVCLIISSLFFFNMKTLTGLLVFAAVFFFFSAPIGGLGDSLSQRRSSALGISFGSIRTWGSIGFAISSITVGEILAAFGVQYTLFPYLFFCGIALVVCFLLTDVKVTTPAVQLKDLKQLISNKQFFLFLLLVMFITVTHRANDSFMGIYINQLGGSERLIGFSWFLGVASEALVFAFSALWFRKFHPLIFIIGAGLLYSIRWFIYGLVDDPFFIVALQFLHGLTFGVFYLTTFHYISRLIPKILQSTGHLVFLSVFFGVSGILGSLIGGGLIDTVGGGTLYIAMGCSALVGSICLSIYHLIPVWK